MVKAVHGGWLICVLIIASSSLHNGPAYGQTGIRAESLSKTSALRACSPNADAMYDRQSVLNDLNRFLKKSIGVYKEFPLMGFFVYDLTDPSNSYKSRRNGLPEEGCINFINHHIYHFSTAELSASKSQIVILEDGKLKFFKSINCKAGKDSLEDVLRYVNEKFKDDKNKDSLLTRLKHYRRYGAYHTVDETSYSCNAETIPPNSDKLYSRRKVLYQFADLLGSLAPQTVSRDYPYYLIEEDRAIGFFIYDLTEPSNKQTSLLERIEFKNHHVYHFAHIDQPSISNIAMLEDGKIKIFKAISCAGKGDSLEDVIRYLNEKLKDDKDRDEIIKRVRNYRNYGTYSAVNGVTPECEAIKTEKQ